MKRLMSLWGSGAKAEDEPKDETEEEKTTREKAEKDKADKEAADKAAAEADDLEGDEEEEDEETKAAAAAVPAKVRASIVRAERSRIHAIVDGGGRDRVEASLHVALNTNLGAKAALGLIAANAGDTAAPSGGRLGLQADMAGRRQPQLGAAPGGPKGPAGEADQAAAFVLKAGKA